MPRKETRPLTDFGRFIKERIAKSRYKNQSEFTRETKFVPMTLNRYMYDPEPNPDYKTFSALADALEIGYSELNEEFERLRPGGSQSSKAQRRIDEPDLGTERIAEIIKRRRESPDVAEAMGKLYTSLGPFKYTPKTYVITALSALARELRAGRTEEQAIEAAKRDAAEAVVKLQGDTKGITQLRSPTPEPPAEPQKPPTNPDSSVPPPVPQRRKSATRR